MRDRLDTHRVLIVEDEAVVALALRRQLEANGFCVAAIVGASDQVLAAVQQCRPSVVLMDVRIRGDVDGITLAEELFVCEDVAVVFLSAFSDREVIERATRSGAYGFLTKPVAIGPLVATLEMAVRKHRDLRDCREGGRILRMALDGLDVPIVCLDGRGVVGYINRAAVELTGWARVEARDESPRWAQELQSLPADDGRLQRMAHGDGTWAVRKFALDGGGSVCVIRPVAAG